ncbi:MAG: hypothetical protein GY941_25890 [Planctomycetes bacterium]|nr:hypothetical protein [Planctomycetota bacterium]
MAKEMILVDPAMWTALNNNNNKSSNTQSTPLSNNIATRVVRQTDKDISNILSSDLDPNEQAFLYSQALQKREQYADQTPAHLIQNKLLSNINPIRAAVPAAQGSPIIKPEKIRAGLDPTIEREIVDTLPVSFAGKADRLVRKMKQGGVLGWNARGNLTFRGEIIPNTNVVDLVSDVVRKRKNARGPEGWELFAEGMQETNVPQELIGNVDRYSGHQMFGAAAAAVPVYNSYDDQPLPPARAFFTPSASRYATVGDDDDDNRIPSYTPSSTLQRIKDGENVAANTVHFGRAAASGGVSTTKKTPFQKLKERNQKVKDQMQREKNVREQLGSAPFQEDDGNGMMGMTSLAESDEESGDDELTRSLNHTWLNYRS